MIEPQTYEQTTPYFYLYLSILLITVVAIISRLNCCLSNNVRRFNFVSVTNLIIKCIKYYVFYLMAGSNLSNCLSCI